MGEKPRFLKKFEVWEKRRKIAELFREALEAENRGELEIAKKKLDEIMELSRDEFPEIYFEACFKLAEVFYEEENYRGCVKCALRALYYAPSWDLYILGAKRLRDVLFVLKQRGLLDSFKENMALTCKLIEGNPELCSFVKALISIAEGNREIEKYLDDISTPEIKEILTMLIRE
ncbi:hypothetical protein [Thermococcus paralvinellae]|uniref:Uncharacterized protein n=1 Tax=Thermococcus paralvinellae TaxID=582419 RepID=W0I6R9_9EURY|nr:hypothetical protein [Thermococcus paralvinellae]AHF80417.1 Hypothetical protein TES1_1033 [Thermococcus paralvinellae]